MSNLNSNNDFSKWLNELRDFYTANDVKHLSKILMDVYMHSEDANCKTSRMEMYFFLNIIQKFPSNN